VRWTRAGRGWGVVPLVRVVLAGRLAPELPLAPLLLARPLLARNIASTFGARRGSVIAGCAVFVCTSQLC
jgi:hypothetical protein